MSFRIGMVCPYSLSIPGGVQAQVLGLARELRRGGHEVRVLGPCDGPPPEPFVTPLGDSLPTAANGSVAPLAPDPAAVLRTVRALRDEDFDVVHVHEPLAPGPSITTVTLHAAPTVGTFHAAGHSTSYQVFAPMLRRLIERIDRKVVVSKDALALVRDHLGGEYDLLFNGVETSEIAAVEPLRSASGRPAIFFLGRHEERKGLEVLLAAFARLDLDVELWVAGEGPDTHRLRSLHDGDDRIAWLGRIDEADKVARLRGASVFCAPSLHGESFGVVLIEAMAAGTPVVASALDGYRNVATDDVDSVLVPPGDVDALAGALRRVLADHHLADRLVRAGDQRADHFAMSRLAAEYVALYEAIAR
ncbi:MAG: glycosyltransferase family 4 protein [Ilumatobacter fluminis]|uniref:glycosyltransferase family 4 protein n=1 Tax=Ilumatobacter fluminis TaxID=467091 RepID=UPI0032EF6B57